jgi:phospholipid/cholesterol/gamma-HCH transport system permease protein
MLEFKQSSDDVLTLCLSGEWILSGNPPTANELPARLDAGNGIRKIAFDTGAVTDWDTGLLTFLNQVLEQCRQRGIDADREGLPEGARRLLDLAAAVPERKGARRSTERESPLARIGKTSLGWYEGAREMMTFIGEAVVAFGRLLRGKARFRHSDFLLIVQETGARALPIVTLISFLIGLIMAYMGAVQLQQFGAQIYVANMVALAMAREMGAMMTGIIMAGRTGAAFAAQLGSMRVNEEIDALTTLGIPPMEFLVLPRMLALMLMMPLLTLYADFMGILGGALIGVTSLDIGTVEYYEQTRNSVHLKDFGMGLFKGVVFGILIAISGCLRGMQSGSSSSAVGVAATSAVVTGIVLIIVSDSILTVIYNVLGI